MPNHAIPGHFRLHRIKTNRNPIRFSSVRVGRHSIRPTDGHARGRSKLIPIQFLIPRIKTNRNPVYFSAHSTICMVVCGAYAIRPYTGTRKNDDYFIPRIKTNRNPDKFSSGRVGAYCIRPTNGHARGRMNPIPIRFLIPRIKTNQKPARFSSVLVGAYCIRPTDGHGSGRMKLIPIRFLIHRVKTNRNPVYFSALPTICMVVYGAYAVAPDTGI